MLVCGFNAGTQENWLITQHISRRLTSGTLFDRLSVRIEYQFTSCYLTRNCRQSLDVYKWETSTIDSVAARKTGNYTRVGQISSGSAVGTVQTNSTLDIEFTTEETGLYLALLDRGTCVLIQHILVFYDGIVCPGRAANLINYPEVLAPKHMVFGKCMENSSPTNGSDPALSCTNEGVWEVIMPCLCSPGYENVTDEVTTCSGIQNYT